jgi:tripartite-type tricarboxylate transporter receptor subunit TctC
MLKPTVACTVLLSTAVMAAIPAGAAAQGDPWPVKPVRWIVPFPPGGSVDIIARVLAAKLTESLGQQVIVDNKWSGVVKERGMRAE